MAIEPQAMLDQATKLVRVLQEAGHTTYFAGGCVRDRLRGVEPKDYDIATSATPAEVLDLFPKSDSIGAHFGVVLVKKRKASFEIATFRTDGTYSDGRRPDAVQFSDPESDAKRRDFTVNGMFYDPIAEELIDFVGGQKDLATQTLRAIGNPKERFQEDYLRMLRAIRFATILGYEVEEETWSSLVVSAPEILQVSPERIREELDRIWRHPNRLRGFDLLVSSGLMEKILPEIIELQGVEQPPQWHPEGDVFVHTRLMLSLLPEEASLPLVLSVLFHDIGKPAAFSYDESEDRIRFNGHDKIGAEITRTILNRLRYSNEVIDATVSAVGNHMRFIDVKKMRTSTLKRFMNRQGFSDELQLHKVDCLGSNGNLSNFDYVVAKQEEFAAEPLVPPPFLTGKDLIERGLSPGPEFKTILKEAQDLQLEGDLETRADALRWIEQHLAESRGESADS